LTQTLPLEDIPRLQVLLAGALAGPEMLAATGVSGFVFDRMIKRGGTSRDEMLCPLQRIGGFCFPF
jgi:hypothetical protein